MKVVLFRRFDGVEVLEWTDIEDPPPKPDEIRDRYAVTHAAAASRVTATVQSS